MSITTLRALDRTSATFRDDLDTFFGGEIQTFVTETNATAAAVTADAASASSSASAANGSASTASTQAGIATTKASEAASYAASALSAPGTSATSSSSLSIGLGSKTITIQTGKAYVAGQVITAARTSAPGTYVSGQITSYNSGTGDLVFNVNAVGGSGGPYSDWTVSLGAQSVLGGNNTWLGSQNFARATVASAATTADIWSATGNEIDFTGTASVTNFPAAPQAGASRVLHCAGACTFTHNANIFVPGAANYTAAAGDIVTVHAITTSTFRLEIVRADGKGGVKPNGGLVYLSTVTASGAATADIETTFDSTYDEYLLIASGVSLATTNKKLQCTLKLGGSYAASGYKYNIETSAAGTYSSQSATSATEVSLTGAQGNDSTLPCHLEMRIPNPAGTGAIKMINVVGSYINASGFPVVANGVLTNSSTSALTGIRFSAESGGNLSGTFRLYGIVKQ